MATAMMMMMAMAVVAVSVLASAIKSAEKKEILRTEAAVYVETRTGAYAWKKKYESQTYFFSAYPRSTARCRCTQLAYGNSLFQFSFSIPLLRIPLHGKMMFGKKIAI